MYKNLLVCTDGSKLSEKAVAHAIALAQAVGAGITAFYAAPDYPLPAYADGVVYEPVSRKEYTKLAAADAEIVLVSRVLRGPGKPSRLRLLARPGGEHAGRRYVVSALGAERPVRNRPDGGGSGDHQLLSLFK